MPRDFYPTPAWVTEALAEHVELAGKRILEPACGDGRIAEALRAAGARVCATDIEDRGYSRLQRLLDFTTHEFPQFDGDGIVTNPPSGERNQLAARFVELAIERIGDGGFVAMLLPNDFDCAAGRRHLFGDCRTFYAKLVLTRRIIWFEGPGASPKENHSWFIWRKPARSMRPITLYGPHAASFNEMTARQATQVQRRNYKSQRIALVPPEPNKPKRRSLSTCL
jgi:hypothetical protein